MNKVKQYFNNIANEWDNAEDDIDFITKLLSHLNIKNDDMVLDVGCGKGIITPILHAFSNREVQAIDISENMINDAKKKYAQNKALTFICDDFITHQFDRKFDYIVVFNAFPHFLDVDAFIKKAHDILNKGGHLAIVHSLSKEEVNSHHEQHAKGVSRPLCEASEECKKFKALFEVEKCLDENNSYLMLFKSIL